jgi:hypothetical protein
MTSQIDPSIPHEGHAYTANVRQNFATAQSEISALQDSVASLQTLVSQLQTDNTTLKARTVAATTQTSDVPPDTNSTEFVVSSLAMLFQTVNSTRAVFGIEGALGNDTASSESDVQLVWGPGAAPPVGTLVSDVTGAVLVGPLISVIPSVAGEKMPFAASSLIIGLVVDDNYWVGVAYRALSGNAQLSACTITAFELLDPIPTP